MIFLIGAVVLAGCTEQLNGGSNDEQEEPPVVQVSGPTCDVRGTACSEASLTRYDGPVNIRFEVTNYGQEEMTVHVGEKGREIMVSRCNPEIAAIDGERIDGDANGNFTVRRVSSAAEDDVTGQDSVSLQNQETLIVEWAFDIVPMDDTEVSRLGYTCPFDFRLTFDQVLSTSEQIQIRESEGVEEVAQLDSVTSSKEPVLLEMEFEDHFVASGGRSLPVRGWLNDVGDGEITNISYIRPVGSFWENVFGGDPADNVDGEGDQNDCRYGYDESVQMYTRGDLAGQSDEQICRVENPSDLISTQSNVFWVDYEAEYEYEMPLPSTEFSVNPVRE